MRASVPLTNGASLKVFRPILRQFGDGPRLHQARRSFRPTFPRPRLPASWAVADPVVGNRLQQRVDQPPAILWPRRLDLRGERRDGLLGPLKLIFRGSVSLSASATAMTVRSRLYASRCAQISLRTISGVLHRSTSIFIVDLIERISTSPSHLRSYNSPICLPPTDGSRIVVTTYLLALVAAFIAYFPFRQVP